MKRFEKLYGVSLTAKKLRQMVWMLIGLEAIFAFLTQEFIAFMGLFGIVGIIIQWIYEYYTVLRIKMNQKLLEQSVKISIAPLTGVFSPLPTTRPWSAPPAPCRRTLRCF